MLSFFGVFFQAEAGIRDGHVTGVQTCALPICVNDGLAPLQGPAGEARLNHAERRPVLYRSPRVEPLRLGAKLDIRRSEERRVGKESRLWWAVGHMRKNEYIADIVVSSVLLVHV